MFYYVSCILQLQHGRQPQHDRTNVIYDYIYLLSFHFLLDLAAIPGGRYFLDRTFVVQISSTGRNSPRGLRDILKHFREEAGNTAEKIILTNDDSPGHTIPTVWQTTSGCLQRAEKRVLPQGC
jgi:hypothetical protein